MVSLKLEARGRWLFVLGPQLDMFAICERFETRLSSTLAASSQMRFVFLGLDAGC